MRSSAWAWSRRAWIDAYRGNDEAAIERFSIALELAPNDSLAFNTMFGIGMAALSWSSSRELRTAFENPVVSADARRTILREIAAQSGMDELVRNTLLLMADRGRLGQVVDVAEAFKTVAEARSGRVRAEVITASELPEAYFTELQKTLGAMKGLNEAMGAQRFPGVLQSDWDQVRALLNNLARVYQVETLAVLEPPGGGRGGRGGRGPAAAAAPAPPADGVAPGGGLIGYIVDAACAAGFATRARSRRKSNTAWFDGAMRVASAYAA